MRKEDFRFPTKELQSALGTPKYFIDTPGMKEGEVYSWFPTLGASMTDHSARSIPSGSLVLGRCLHLASVADIPLHRPIVIILDDGGNQFCILKCCCAVEQSEDDYSGRLCLRSYNPAPHYDDFWLPYSCIKFIFVVERVRLADGKEFIPTPTTPAV